MQLEFRVFELLASRLCHDLISPVGAINNGVELMGEKDADFAKDAAALIAQSARRAGHRLQFYRFAFAFGGGTLTGPAPYLLAAEFFAEAASMQLRIWLARLALPTTPTLPMSRVACRLFVWATPFFTTMFPVIF